LFDTRYKFKSGSLLVGDCIEAMESIADESVSSVVTDPPYGIAFMGASWDKIESPLAFQQWCEQWARECLRVLKPGGYLLSFGGARTAHRMIAGIEDAGFEIRDGIEWIYGTGFPKGTNIAKAIDKKRGVKGRVVGKGKGRTGAAAQPQGGSVHSDDSYQWPGKYEVTEAASEEAKRWQGWNSTLKPAHEPICVARKPFKGTLVDNVLKHGAGAINVGACKVATSETIKTTTGCGFKTGKFTGGAGRGEPTLEGEAWENNSGRWPPNLCFSHTDCEQVGVKRVKSGNHGQGAGGYGAANLYGDGDRTLDVSGGYGTEIVPDMRCADDCPVKALGEMSGVTSSHDTTGIWSAREGREGATSPGWGMKARGADEKEPGRADTGTAARFFPQFKYNAKAARKERRIYCHACERSFPARKRKVHKEHGEITSHPTQKPLTLIRWLLRLVVPPDGIVLDPFIGSGTAAIAAIEENMKWIGIEKDPIFAKIAKEAIEIKEDL